MPVGVIAPVFDVSTVGHQIQRVVEVGSGVGVLAVMGIHELSDLVEFTQDAVLLALREGERDRFGVVGLKA